MESNVGWRMPPPPTRDEVMAWVRGLIYPPASLSSISEMTRFGEQPRGPMPLPADLPGTYKERSLAAPVRSDYVTDLRRIGRVKDYMYWGG